jgi:hypothetical protein
MQEEPKKPGRPKVNPKRKSVKPAISIRRDILDEAAAAAQIRGIGLSEYVAMSLLKQVTRDESLNLTALPSPLSGEAQKSNNGG